MERLIIRIHSFVDVITNSSTELFVCNTDKSVDMVKSLIDEMQAKFPNEYGHMLHVDISNKYELQEAFGYMDENDEEKAISFLKHKGYEITDPDPSKSKTYISISAERGGMDERVADFIRDTFNVIHYTSEA